MARRNQSVSARRRFLTACIWLALGGCPMPAATLHVSATAAPGGDGSVERPYDSLPAARIAAQKLRDVPVEVLIGGGHYVMRNGFALGPADSGSPERPVVFRAAPGTSPRLSSGVRVPPEALQPVTDEAIRERLRPEVRDRVRQVSLKELGISVRAPAENFRGLEFLEILCDGKRLPLSRWPEPGRYAKIEKVTDNGVNPPRGGAFVYRGDDPGRWSGALADGLWLRGFWRVPWVIEAVRVQGIDPLSRTITLAAPVSGGIGSKYHRGRDGTGRGSGEEPWEAVNLLEEIDLPGEWAVRFPTDTLYLLPPENSGEILISDVRDPVVWLANVSHVTIEGVTVDCGLGDGIRVEGGENVLIAGCSVSHVARNGVVLQGGRGHMVLSCDIAQTGYSGISFLGGNRQTLEPGGHRILNNIVSHAGVYFPAAGILGGLATRAESVGNLVAHNRIHDTANSGIVYGGNENVFEFNDIYRVGLGSSDLGGFYTTGGWTSRGNIVRNNFVHHAMNANAFYVDDGDSGDMFIGNVAYKTESGGFVGGGHDQVFRGNLIIESPRAMHVDARGVPRRYTAEDPRLRGDLDSVPYRSLPWSEKYPALLKILDHQPELPSGIEIEENVFVRCGTPIRRSGKASELEGVVFENNLVTDDLGIFVDPAAWNFALRPDSEVFRQLPQFQQIPFEKIGPYPDAYRPAVPPRDRERLLGDDTDRGFDSQTDVDASNAVPAP